MTLLKIKVSWSLFSLSLSAVTILKSGSGFKEISVLKNSIVPLRNYFVISIYHIQNSKLVLCIIYTIFANLTLVPSTGSQSLLHTVCNRQAIEEISKYWL